MHPSASLRPRHRRAVYSVGLIGFAVVAFATLGWPCRPAEAASFDCARAVRPDEKAVCSDPKLSALDSLLGKAFEQAIKSGESDERAKARSDARLSLIRRRGCRADARCLMSAYVGAIEDLESDGSELNPPSFVNAMDMVEATPPETRGLPLKEGECTSTRVEDFGGRLRGDTNFSTGTYVDLTNGGTQVDYDKNAAIIASRKGDPVLMCLTSIPKNCPPDDDRGRMYTVTNLRTKQSWSLPDSQHMCGGA